MSDVAPAMRGVRPDGIAPDDARAALFQVGPFVRDTGNALTGQLSWSNMRCVERIAEFTMPSLWTAMTLQNSWAAEAGYLAPAYMKDMGGFVRLRGAADSGTYGASAIATLPSGYRPGAAVAFPAVQANATFEPSGRVNISTAGVITAPDIAMIQTGVSTFLAFDGMSFVAADSVAQPTFPSPFPVLVDVSSLGAPVAAVIVTSCRDLTLQTDWTVPPISWRNAAFSNIPMLAITCAWGLGEGHMYRLGLKIFA